MTDIFDLYASLADEARSAARRFRIWRSIWKTIHYVVGVVGIIGGVAASASALGDATTEVTAIGSIVAAIAVGLQTFLKPAEWSKHNQKNFAAANHLAAEVASAKEKHARGLVDEQGAFEALDGFRQRMAELDASHVDI